MNNSGKYSLIILIFSLSSLFSKQLEDQYVILISFDGFRYDYPDRVETPNFDYIESNGVKAASLKPIFPSFTFPNHYSIATGCYADKHKIIGNDFINSIGHYSYKDKKTVQEAKWYGAEPIWVTAEKNGIIAATYFWVGSEAPINGQYPTYYKNYQSGIDPRLKVDQAIDWLKLPIKKRPQLICLYFNEPDHAGHVYGANSEEVNSQVTISDNILGYLLNSIKKLKIYNNINIVIVSDHGMVDVSIDKTINIDNYKISGFIHGKGPVMELKKIDSSDNGLLDISDLLSDGFSIPNVTITHAKNNEELHYHNENYDFLLIAEEGWMMYKNDDLQKYGNKLPVKGMHGYDSNNMNMHAIFYSYGPIFLSGVKIDTFELIHIYPMLCEILNIEPYADIDGSLEILKPILK